MVKSVLNIFIALFYLFSATSGEQVVMHVCADMACESCATDTDDCCSSKEEKKCNTKKDCCSEVVINTHFSLDDATGEISQSKPEKSHAQSSSFSASFAEQFDICTLATYSEVGLREAEVSSDFHQFHLIHRRVLYC